MTVVSTTINAEALKLVFVARADADPDLPAGRASVIFESVDGGPG